MDINTQAQLDSELHAWARNNNLQKVMSLLAQGANPNTKECGITSALQIAVIWATREVVQALLAGGGDPNLPHKGGNTPTHMAVKDDRHGILVALVAAGGDLDIPNDAGETPHSLARRLYAEGKQSPQTVDFCDALKARASVSRTLSSVRASRPSPERPR